MITIIRIRIIRIIRIIIPIERVVL